MELHAEPVGVGLHPVLAGVAHGREVDEKLRAIMSSIYDASAAAAEEYGLGYDLIAGNDIGASVVAGMLAPST